MPDALNFVALLRVFSQPMSMFDALSRNAPDAHRVFFQLILPLCLVPPVLAFIGGGTFGWQLGSGEPLALPSGERTLISLAYFAALTFGFVSTAALASWMAGTYGARKDFGTHLALLAPVAVPVVLASFAHLAPHVFINLLLLIPALIWSLYLLYRGLPRVLGIPPERGMLMASALVGYLLVALVSLLGITVVLWTSGIGPAIGV